MKLLHEAVDEKKFDTRLVEANLQRGRVHHKDLEQALKTLPDDAQNAAWSNVEELSADANGGD